MYREWHISETAFFTFIFYTCYLSGHSFRIALWIGTLLLKQSN
jgi:hypothetical protein